MFASNFVKIFFLVVGASCGPSIVSRPSFDAQIVGGDAMNITDAPWTVSFQVEERGERFHICGGSIISDRWIMTSGMCANRIKRIPSNGRILAGSSACDENGDFYTVKSVFQHPNFDEHEIDFDFGLLELAEPVKFDNTKQPIKLNNFDEIFRDGEMCLVTGFGSTNNPKEENTKLRGVKIPIVNHQKCAKAYEGFREVRYSMICAGDFDKGGKDGCIGDAGGPLVAFSTTDGQPRLVGMISWRKECGLPKYPGVYSKVLSAREWIRDISGI